MNQSDIVGLIIFCITAILILFLVVANKRADYLDECLKKDSIELCKKRAKSIYLF